MWSLVVLVVAVSSSVQGKCPRGCTVPVTPNEEMGCEAVFAKPEDCCPSHYNCAKIEGRAADKCFVQGNVYNEGDKIDLNLTCAHCLAACQCRTDFGQGILCGHYDCPELLGIRELEPGCFYTYSLDHCCASRKIICPPFDNLAECEYQGKTYLEGQKWYPDGEKTKCVCKPRFIGKIEEPFCAEVKCGIELRHPRDFKNKCAPVFYGTARCPVDFECPKDGESYVLPNQKGSTSEQKCSYGDQKLNIGDKLILQRADYKPKPECECKIPPLVTCIQVTSH